MATILDIQNLQVTYGIHEAVSGVNMQIEEGKITAIITASGQTVVCQAAGPHDLCSGFIILRNFMKHLVIDRI